jgi:predicted nucleotidyltransferase
MAQKRRVGLKLREIARRFARDIEAEGIPVARIILFGSHARRVARPDSDIDLCVVSPRFGRDRIDELQFLLKRTSHIDPRIEPYPASPREWRHSSSPLMEEIRRHGLEIELKPT